VEAHTILQWIQATILHKDNRRNWTIKLDPGVEMVMPGDNAEFEVELIYPVALEEGMRFAIREGGRTVGAGVITKLLE